MVIMYGEKMSLKELPTSPCVFTLNLYSFRTIFVKKLMNNVKSMSSLNGHFRFFPEKQATGPKSISGLIREDN